MKALGILVTKLDCWSLYHLDLDCAHMPADHGRESRHPFLDENFMIKMLDLPLVLVADLEKPGACLFQ